MQGHALATRQAGSTLACPYVDYIQGFNSILGAAYGLPPGETIEKLFGKPWGRDLILLFIALLTQFELLTQFDICSAGQLAAGLAAGLAKISRVSAQTDHCTDPLH